MAERTADVCFRKVIPVAETQIETSIIGVQTSRLNVLPRLNVVSGMNEKCAAQVLNSPSYVSTSMCVHALPVRDRSSAAATILPQCCLRSDSMLPILGPLSLSRLLDQQQRHPRGQESSTDSWAPLACRISLHFAELLRGPRPAGLGEPGKVACSPLLFQNTFLSISSPRLW